MEDFILKQLLNQNWSWPYKPNPPDFGWRDPRKMTIEELYTDYYKSKTGIQ